MAYQHPAYAGFLFRSAAQGSSPGRRCSRHGDARIFLEQCSSMSNLLRLFGTRSAITMTGAGHVRVGFALAGVADGSQYYVPRPTVSLCRSGSHRYFPHLPK